MAIDIPPAKQRLTYGGVALDDDAERLWERGVRTDDVIVLEFESPVLPDELRVLRSPAAEKPKKGEGGGRRRRKKKKRGRSTKFSLTRPLTRCIHAQTTSFVAGVTVGMPVFRIKDDFLLASIRRDERRQRTP